MRLHRVFKEPVCSSSAQGGKERDYMAFFIIFTPDFFVLKHLVKLLQDTLESTDYSQDEQHRVAYDLPQVASGLESPQDACFCSEHSLNSYPSPCQIKPELLFLHETALESTRPWGENPIPALHSPFSQHNIFYSYFSFLCKIASFLEKSHKPLFNPV